MMVHVGEPRQRNLPREVEHLRRRRNGDSGRWAHRRDSTAANHDSHVLPRWTSREVQNLDVIQHDDSHGSVLCGQQYGTRQHQQREEESRHQALPCIS